MEIKEFFKPKSLSEAFEVLNANSNNKIIGGGAWIKISLKKVDTLISLEELNLNYIKEEKDFIEIGSMSSLRDMEVNEGIKSLASGILSQAISNIMGVTVRNIATIGGSVMGKFAFSDLLGVLQVLDAELMFYHSGIMNIEDFVNMTKIPKDILLAIRIKKQSGKGYFKKIAITHLDFSILNIAITYNEGIKIAVGSRPNIAIRARRTEEFLNSFKIITEDKINEAVDIAFEEIKLGDNSRASKDYREILMKTYLKRAIREVM